MPSALRDTIRPAELCLSALAALIALTDILLAPRHLGIAGAAAVATCCAAPLVRRRHAAAAALVLAPVIVIGRLAGGDLGNTLWIGLGATCYALGTRADRRVASTAAAGLLVACETALAIKGNVSSPPFIFLVLGSFTLGSIVESHRVIVTELARQTKDLAAEHDTFVELSVRHERARIARELHDVIAHCVAVMVIQAGAGRITAGGTADATANALTRIREAGNQALDEIEKLVELLDRGRSGTDDHRLHRLVEQSNRAGLRVSLIAAEPIADPQLEAVAFRVVQEGLTNAIKHAPGAQVTVAIRHARGALEVEILDDGAHASAAGLQFVSSKLGLTGMRERVTGHGGTLTANSMPNGGWQLHARLPDHDG